jgi:hypothetical protein
VISSFPRGIEENSDCVNSSTTFRDDLSAPSSRVMNPISLLRTWKVNVEIMCERLTDFVVVRIGTSDEHVKGRELLD